MSTLMPRVAIEDLTLQLHFVQRTRFSTHQPLSGTISVRAASPAYLTVSGARFCFIRPSESRAMRILSVSV